MRHSGNRRLVLLSTASVWALAAVMPLWAQAPVRDEAAQQQLERTREDVLLQQTRRARDKPALDRNAAAESLQQKAPDILSKLPTDENLARLQILMQTQPHNLDYAFAYGQMAAAMGLYAEAAAAYESMLARAPQLHRVRLDLGAMYLRLGRLEDAKRELEAVLQHNPPEPVRDNIVAILTQVDGEVRAHRWSGSLTAGVNLDSNGNSAPDRDAILLFDTVQGLAPEQRAQQDLQFFTAATIGHHYGPKEWRGESIGAKWKTDVTAYRAEQSSLETLDLQLIGVRTGPEFRSQLSGITVSPSLGYNHIVLAGHTYLRNSQAELETEVPLADWMVLSLSGRHEFREFENAPGVTVYEDRTGSASQWTIGSRFMLSEKDFLSLQFTARRERTRVEYYDNRQLGLTASYTRLLPGDLFAGVTAGYKNSMYDGPDAELISARTRHDKEWSLGLNLGYRLTDDITASVGYQYRDTESNLINYDYENHRFSGAVTWRF